MTYEERLKKRIEIIENCNAAEIDDMRESFKIELTNIDYKLKQGDMSEGRRKFLIGYRKFVILPSLNYIKQKIKTINRIRHNGTTKEIAFRFVDIAFRELNIRDFERIYGLSLLQEDVENQTIKDIKAFMRKCFNNIN